MIPVRVLTYQKIGTAPKNTPLKNEWTSLRTLTRTLDKIKKRGLTTVSPLHLSNVAAPQRTVLLLFLDGYRSFYTHVYPLLKARDLSACVCLPTACIGTYNCWQDPPREFWQDLLTWEEIQVLAKDPLISFGVQALNREDISLLSPEQARYNAQESVFRLTKLLPKPPELFAAFPAKKPLTHATEWLPDFRGLIVAPDGNLVNDSPLSFQVIRGNSWRAW